jgi:hypothetical protein
VLQNFEYALVSCVPMSLPRLLSKQWVDDLWDAAVTEIARALQLQLETFNDATVILEVKELIVHFCQTLQSYGYSCSRLYVAHLFIFYLCLDGWGRSTGAMRILIV